MYRTYHVTYPDVTDGESISVNNLTCADVRQFAVSEPPWNSLSPLMRVNLAVFILLVEALGACVSCEIIVKPRCAQILPSLKEDKGARWN